MPPKPWKTLTSQRLRHNLRVDTCELPNGNTLDALVFENRPWVCVLALTPDQKVVLIRQYRHGAGEMVWEIPGGVVDAEDESLEAAAKRELLEESGFAAAQWVALGSLSPDPCSHNNRINPFLALDAYEASGQHLDENEDIEVHLVPLDEVISMARNSQLPQAMQVSALFLALAHLGRVT